MKPGTKLISHCGNDWNVAHYHNHDKNRVVVKTHKGDHFIVARELVKYYAIKLRWYHRFCRWVLQWF